MMTDEQLLDVRNPLSLNQQDFGRWKVLMRKVQEINEITYKQRESAILESELIARRSKVGRDLAVYDFERMSNILGAEDIKDKYIEVAAKYEAEQAALQGNGGLSDEEIEMIKEHQAAETEKGS